MTTIQAHEVWELSIDKVLEICRILNLEKVKGQYEIPDMKTPYYPDMRFFKKRNRLHIYLHVLNAITEEKLIIPEILKTDFQHVKTAVRELRDSGAIVLMVDADDNLDYNNYMVGMRYSDWTRHGFREKMEIITSILSVAKTAKELSR